MAKRLAGLEDIEEAVGHRFDDRDLLKRALTHSSLSADIGRDLERLEFLGDRVLGLLTADALWRRFPDLAEGELAPRLNQMVRKETCADAARSFRVGDALKMSSGEENNGGRDRDAILGDAMEALLGALYIDGGLQAANRAWERYWGEHFEKITSMHRDPKTSFQEWAQANGYGTPSYVDVDRKGPDHAPCFTVEVRAGKLDPAQGEGPSKRDAQAAAALRVLRREGIWADA